MNEGELICYEYSEKEAKFRKSQIRKQGIKSTFSRTPSGRYAIRFALKTSPRSPGSFKSDLERDDEE